MSRTRWSRKTVSVLGVLGILAMFAASPAAWGASNARPAVTFRSGSTVDGATLTAPASADLSFSINRAPHAIASLTCTLTVEGTADAGTWCDPMVAVDRKQTDSGRSYDDLGPGEYTFTVGFVLTDGGSASASRTFSVEPSADPCAGVVTLAPSIGGVPSTLTPGQAVDLAASVSPDVSDTEFHWTITAPDGTTSTDVGPSATVSIGMPGPYTADLEATECGLTDGASLGFGIPKYQPILTIGLRPATDPAGSFDVFLTITGGYNVSGLLTITAEDPNGGTYPFMILVNGNKTYSAGNYEPTGGPGTYTFSADYPGNAWNESASATQTLEVTG